MLKGVRPGLWTRSVRAHEANGYGTSLLKFTMYIGDQRDFRFTIRA